MDGSRGSGLEYLHRTVGCVSQVHYVIYSSVLSANIATACKKVFQLCFTDIGIIARQFGCVGVWKVWMMKDSAP